MALQRGIVELENYNSKWVNIYKDEEKLLRQILKNEIIEINHVGSTSIPGLKSKPVIDIIVVIANLEDIEKIELLLKDYNYENRGHQGINDRCFFAKGPSNARSHYIHFVEANSDAYYDLMYFKKYLIEHPEYKKQYCKLKQELAKKYANERSKYTAGKSEFIKKVVKLAKEEYNR